VTLKGAKRRGRHTAIIDPETFGQVQHVLDAHRASGDRFHKHSHHLVGSQLRCKPCRTRLGYSRNKGNGGVYEYFTCLSRVSMTGRCAAPYFRAHLVERAIERKYKTYLITPDQQAAVREVLLAHAETTRTVASDDATRHERRVRELISQQQKLLELYYDDGVSKEVLQAEQKRIKTEQATIERLVSAARYEVTELDHALDDALLLIDTRTAPYLSGSPTERRLINLAIYSLLLVSGIDTVRAKATPVYAQLDPLARQLALEASQKTRPAQGQRRRPKTAVAPTFGATARNHRKWRKGGDSNPRSGGYPLAGFQDQCIQPLCHPSTVAHPKRRLLKATGRWPSELELAGCAIVSRRPYLLEKSVHGSQRRRRIGSAGGALSSGDG
jgi:hypothetical protein